MGCGASCCTTGTLHAADACHGAVPPVDDCGVALEAAARAESSDGQPSSASVSGSHRARQRLRAGRNMFAWRCNAFYRVATGAALQQARRCWPRRRCTEMRSARPFADSCRPCAPTRRPRVCCAAWYFVATRVVRSLDGCCALQYTLLCCVAHARTHKHAGARAHTRTQTDRHTHTHAHARTHTQTPRRPRPQAAVTARRRGG
jgi:hypothetical protein